MPRTWRITGGGGSVSILVEYLDIDENGNEIVVDSIQGAPTDEADAAKQLDKLLDDAKKVKDKIEKPK